MYQQPRIRPMTPNFTYEALKVMMPFVLSTTATLSGYDVRKQTGISLSGSYLILARLEDHGLLCSKKEDAPKHGQLPRKLYHITDEGLSMARTALAPLQLSA